MRVRLLPAVVAVLAAIAAAVPTSDLHAQWQIENSGATADLRGIHSVGNGIAWASGTAGTVLRTTDDGLTWQRCPTPPSAEHLDFRGIQAFDANTAIVMSSGKGDLSRLYKTTDGCKSWKLVFTNPDKDGFWDAIKFQSNRPGSARTGILVGDPVDGNRTVFLSQNEGFSWQRWAEGTYATDSHCKEHASHAEAGEGLFAASNSSLYEWFGVNFAFVTGGTPGAKLIFQSGGDADGMLPCRLRLSIVPLPLARGNAGGAFSLTPKEPLSYFPIEAMVVGGDYSQPTATTGNAIFLSTRQGELLPGQKLFRALLPQTPPHGYRSAVAYDKKSDTWITVGPNGTDVSTDDGRNWRALKPGPTDPTDADRDWNALSLPFVVGPHGRIGRLRPEALPSH